MKAYISNTAHQEWRQAHFSLEPSVDADRVLYNAMKESDLFMNTFLRVGVCSIYPVSDSDPRLGTFEV